ncbi:uncharacterized protein CG7065-like [Bradysia coprophila]|uniref:uncharacterized protein CG7065-like n=1 Tax=Bradysia coprophila TaxID=38358 RepID=UPI00187D93AF|nr:uncharacterized protein CG7065-like [Bradysia coprophila]
MAQRVSNDLTINDVIRNRDNSNVLYGEHQQKNVNRLLSLKIKDANGKLNNMFAVIEANDSKRFCCLLCSTNNMDVLKLISHAGSKKHKLKLGTIDEKGPSSNQLNGSTVEASSELQERLDKITDQVMIGMEYIIEVSFGDTFEPIFHCVLCEGRFDLQVIIHHLTSYVHRLNYLEKHFPTAFKKISAMEKREQKYNFLEKICQNIENRYGRLSIKTIQSDEFSVSQAVCYESVLNSKHIDEKMGRTFTEFMDINQTNGLSPVSEFDETTSIFGLESISTSSEFEMSPLGAHNKVLIRPSTSMLPSQKSALSPISPERTQEFDKRFRSCKSSPQLSTHHSPFHVKTSNSTSSSSCRRKESKYIDKKHSSLRIVDKPPNRKCSHADAGQNRVRSQSPPGHRGHRQKDSKTLALPRQSRDRSRSPPEHRKKKPHSKLSKNRDRSRSPQRHQALMQNYRQSLEDYDQIRTCAYFESQRKFNLSSERSESALYRPSYEIPSRTDYLLSYNRRYNHPIEPVTAKDYRFPASIEWKINSEEHANRADYSLIYNGGCNYDRPPETIPASIEWGFSDGEYALPRSYLKRASRADYSMSYNSAFNRPTDSIPTSIDYGEYVLSRPHRKGTNQTDCLLSYNRGFKHPTETGLSKDCRPTSSDPAMDEEEPITIISVLSLLSAFENYLGSLGPKMIELMTEAIAMETIGVNFSNQMLDDLNHCILFETTREKLKGLLSAGIVDENKTAAVKRTIRHMDVLIDEANARKRIGTTSSQNSNNRIDATDCSAASPAQNQSRDRYAVAEKILVAMNEQGRSDISKVKLAQYVDQYESLANAKECDDERRVKSEMGKLVDKSLANGKECDAERGVKSETGKVVGRSHRQRNYVEPSKKTEPITDVSKNSSIIVDSTIPNTRMNNISLKTDPTTDDAFKKKSSAFQAFPSTTLSDSNLTTLMKNFYILSDTEKQEVITNIREIERHEPERMQRLRNQMEIDKFLNFKFGSSETVVLKKLKSETAAEF